MVPIKAWSAALALAVSITLAVGGLYAEPSIEWGERIADYFDAPLSIRIGFGDHETERQVTFTAEDPRWRPVLEALA